MSSQKLARHSLTTIVFFGVLTFGVGAAGATTLPEAVESALRYNPGINSFRLQEKMAETRLTEAAGSYLPTLSVGENFISTNNPLNSFGILLNEALVTSSSFSNLNSLNNPANTQTFGFQAQVAETIFSGGGRFHAVRAASRRKSAGEETLRWKEEELVFDTSKAYLDSLLAVDSVRLLEEMVRMAAEEEKIAKDRVSAGKSVRAELLSAGVHLNHQKTRLLEAKKEAELSRVRLARLLGDARTSDRPLPDPSVLSRAAAIYRSMSGQGVDNLVAEALSARPDYRSLKKEIAARREMASAKLAGFFPQVSAQGLYNEYNPTLAWGKQDYTVIGQVQWNLFNGLSDRERRQRASLSVLEALERERDLKNTLIYEVRAASAEAGTLHEALKVDEERMAEEAEERRIVHERYQVGLVRTADMLRSDVAYRRARLRLLADRTHFVEAVLAERKAIGRLSGNDPVLRGGSVAPSELRSTGSGS
ncbi:MAG: TolC family protein [Leptospirillia bacterium]